MGFRRVVWWSGVEDVEERVGGASRWSFLVDCKHFDQPDGAPEALLSSIHVDVDEGNIEPATGRRDRPDT